VVADTGTEEGTAVGIHRFATCEVALQLAGLRHLDAGKDPGIPAGAGFTEEGGGHKDGKQAKKAARCMESC
jgi:hypothetical protein